MIARRPFSSPTARPSRRRRRKLTKHFPARTAETAADVYLHRGAGISVSAAKNIQIVGNVVARSGEWNFHSGPNNTAIRVAATGAQIRNNVINGAAGAGIQIGGGAVGIEVTGNIARNAGEWGVESRDRAAVYLQNSPGAGDIKNVRVADNLFTDTRNDSSKTMERAVQTRDDIGASAIVIEHNDARGLKKLGGKEKPWLFDELQADPRIGPTWLVRENIGSSAEFVGR